MNTHCYDPRDKLLVDVTLVSETHLLFLSAKSEQRTDGEVYPSEYKYNLAGALIEQKYPSGRVVKNIVDASGDISNISSRVHNGPFKNYASNFEYTAGGVIKHLQIGNGLWESAVMNSRNQVLELKMGNSPTNGGLMHLTYEYGEFDTGGNVDVTKNAGNIAKQTITFNGLANPFVQSYKYDSLDRITEAKETVNGGQTWIQTFGYDRYGNRTSHAETVGSQAKAINEVTLPAVDASTNKFSNTTDYEFDAVGNLIRDIHGRQYTFNGDNKQVEVRNSANQVVGEYKYDGLGKRIKKDTATEYVVFVYDGLGKLIGEYSADGPPAAPTVNYTATDPLGSPRVLTNKQGEMVSRRDFMPFGEEIAAMAETHRTPGDKYGVGDGVRQKFTGYEHDEETGLDFAEARYYYNNHGRFTAVDPLLASGKSADPQTFNRYTYTMNRPLILTDLTGLQTGPPPARKNLDIEQVDDPQKRFVDANLTRIFTDGNGFVRSSSAVRANAFPGDSHYKLEDGTLHTIHIYGSKDGKEVAGIFVPKEFDRMVYVGGSENSVNAINSETGEVLRVSHVDAQSQKEVDANLSSGRENEAGSRFVANTGGQGGDGEGNIHSHVTYFKSTSAMRKAMDAKYAPKNMSGGETTSDYTSKEKAYLGDFRRFSTFRVCKSTRPVP